MLLLDYGLILPKMHQENGWFVFIAVKTMHMLVRLKYSFSCN